jgi:hypothetical protein
MCTCELKNSLDCRVTQIDRADRLEAGAGSPVGDKVAVQS